MPSWILKATVQGLLSLLPNPQRYNRLFQKHGSGSLTLRDEFFLTKYRKVVRHLATYGERAKAEGLSPVVVELGTGWFPIVPIGMALNGARRVYSVDKDMLLAHDTIVDTLEAFQRLRASGELELKRADAGDRLRNLLTKAPSLSAEAVLAELGIETLVTDARRLPLDAGSVDLICSNNTLEHIPRPVIEDIFREFRRVLEPEGLMSHHIDIGDQYSYFDPSITVYNYLKFSERSWSLANNSLQYQNRLRVTDYREIHEQTGWQLLGEDNLRKPAAELRGIRLAPRFRGYSEEDLLVYNTWMRAVIRK